MDKNLNFIRNIIYIIIVFSALYLFGVVINLQLNILMQLIIISIIALVIKYLILNPFIIYILLSVILLTAIIINHFFLIFFDLLKRNVVKLFLNILNNLKGNERISPEYTLIFWIILLVFLSLITAFIIFKKKKISYLVPIYLSIFLYYWYTFIDSAYPTALIFLMAFIILISISSFSFIKNEEESKYKKDIERLYYPWINTGIKYGFIIVLISALLPKSNNYHKWNYLQNKVYTYFPFVEDLRSNTIYTRSLSSAKLFDFSTTGFQSDPIRLGGPVVLSSKKVMTIEGKDIKYVRGNVKTKYTGNYWTQDSTNSKDYAPLDKFVVIPDKDKDNLYEISDMTIINHNFSSTTLFSQWIPEYVNLIDEAPINVSNDFDLILKQGIYHNESYFVRSLKPLPYGKLIIAGVNNKKKNIKNIDNYLKIPDARITYRTRRLVYDLIDNIEGDFEKAKIIEDFLRNNFKYNLNVENTPEEFEFIDYFLFEGKKGYCTYYASSMAIMLRIANIPSRYIEGFLVKDMSDVNKYEVRQENAHAWVEAFIEPVGWMIFEATPEFPIESRLEDYMLIELEEEININKNTNNELENESIRNRKELQLEDIDIIDVNADLDYRDSNKTMNKNIWIYIFIILLSIVLIRISIGILSYIYKEYKISKLSNNEKIIYLYNEIVRLISLLGYPPKLGETHYEYAKRIAYKFYAHSEIEITEITEIFVRSKYSTDLSSDIDVKELENYRSNLNSRAKKTLGYSRYYYNKYIVHSPIQHI